MPEHAVENTESTSAERSRHVTQFKPMLICFFDHRGIVHYEFIAQTNGESAVLFGSAD
jgi:hypothetical protein